VISIGKRIWSCGRMGVVFIYSLVNVGVKKNGHIISSGRCLEYRMKMVG
jgi:hypothetical protein